MRAEAPPQACPGTLSAHPTRFERATDAFSGLSNDAVAQPPANALSPQRAAPVAQLDRALPSEGIIFLF